MTSVIKTMRDLAKIMTSKRDSPPPYEDAVHHPKYGNYPQEQQHGSPLPPPPSYSPSPGMCHGPPGYWGHEGVYPQAGMWSAPGFSPSGMPMTIPTLSAGVPPSNSGSEEMTQDFSKSHPAFYLYELPRVINTNYRFTIPNSAGDMEDLQRTQWESTSIRHAFIRKVRIFIIPSRHTQKMLLTSTASTDMLYGLNRTSWFCFYCRFT
ncbi:hypothetical protein INR49_025170 [Caranx melampygus]|nr:hypothetical protein INR49_025170 [Caranx melampygus]